MDMNKTFFLRKEDVDPKWHEIDATDQVLGRMATKVADLLRGKGKAEYTPHTDCGDYVIITNCKSIKLTGNKWKDKIYKTYSGWQGGLKEKTATEVMEKHPEKIIKLAVKRMLPDNRMSSKIIKRLKVYEGSEHPHTAQMSKASQMPKTSQA